MKHLSDLEKWKLIVRADVNEAAAELGHYSPEQAGRMADQLGVAYLVSVASQLGSAGAADLLRHLPADFRDRVIAELSPPLAASVREVLSYPPGTAGSLMAKEYLTVPVDHTIGKTAEYLRTVPIERRGKVSYVYVVDPSSRLEGVIQLRDLLFYPDPKLVREILKKPVVQVETGMSQLDVARLLERHRYLGLPVVDASQRLVGVVSADSVMGVFENEASDDIAKIVGTGAEEIRSRSVRRIMRVRLPWLFVNIVSGLLCALISGLFENSVRDVAALFVFVPVVLALSESTGVQGATMVVRNLALGHMSFRGLGSLFIKESLVGVCVGLICGAVVGTAAFVWRGNPHLGAAVGASMVLTIILSALIGLALPMLFKRFKIDPAIASGPLVLALCDLQTLSVYFSMSSMILRA